MTVDASTSPPQPSGTQASDPSGFKPAVTEDLVRVIADQVYAMLLRELKQERERDRISLHTRNAFRGGW